ncbi:MAG: hypothetical protein PHV18_05710 [Lachnospiraceae bacterium]|nr:hypothetical protein [Lachnospiraceae bacterium]
MKELEVLREKFGNKEMRGILYLAAFIMTVINMIIFIHCMNGKSLVLWILLALISGGITLALYYVTDTLSSLISVILFAAKIGKAFAAFMGMLTMWMVGLGFLIQIMLTVMTYMAVIVGGAALAYMYPIVIIPIFVVCGNFVKKLSESKEMIDSAQTQGTSEMNMNWNHIYEEVMSAVNENK